MTRSKCRRRTYVISNERNARKRKRKQVNNKYKLIKTAMMRTRERSVQHACTQTVSSVCSNVVAGPILSIYLFD